MTMNPENSEAMKFQKPIPKRADMSSDGRHDRGFAFPTHYTDGGKTSIRHFGAICKSNGMSVGVACTGLDRRNVPGVPTPARDVHPLRKA